MSKQSDLKSRDGALIENWYIACLSSELGQEKPLRRMIYDTSYVLFRSKSAAAVCLVDRCLHRHAQLSQGVIIEGKIACPYHGWMYDEQGCVSHVPSEGPGTCLGGQIKLKSLVCVEQDGCVWVWMGEGEPKTSAPPFRFPHFQDPTWKHYFMITDFDNEVTQLVENFMDVPHTVFVHSKWFRNQSAQKVPISVSTAEGSVLVTYQQPNDQIGFTNWILNPKNEKTFHTDRFIMPNITRVDYGFGSRGFVIISQDTPVSTLKTKVYTAIIVKLGAITGALLPFLKFYTRQVIQQDVEIMQNQAENLRENSQCSFNNTGADILHQSIEQLRAWGVEKNPLSHTHSEEQEGVLWI